MVYGDSDQSGYIYIYMSGLLGGGLLEYGCFERRRRVPTITTVVIVYLLLLSGHVLQDDADYYSTHMDSRGRAPVDANISSSTALRDSRYGL